MRTIVTIAALLSATSFAQAQSTYRYGNEVPQQNYGNVTPGPSYGNVLPQQNYGNAPIQPNYGNTSSSYGSSSYGTNLQTGYATPAYGSNLDSQQRYGGSTYGSDLTPLQRSLTADNLRSANIPPLQGNIRVTVGQTLAPSTQFGACPPAVAGLIRGVGNCQVVSAGDRYYIIDGSTRRVVDEIKR